MTRQLLTGQLRYAVHTLGFHECTELQKRWALYTACEAARHVDEYYSQVTGLFVDWLPEEETPGGRIGLTILPGRRDMRRDLSRDVEMLEHEGTTHVVCLLSSDELAAYGVPEALDVYRQRSFQVHQLPIKDQVVCSVEEMHAAVGFMCEALKSGGRVVIHCAGGLGRSGIAAAAYLTEARGRSADEAIALVRRVRSPRAVETEAQERFVERYAAHGSA